jgi:hypothetical protein
MKRIILILVAIISFLAVGTNSSDAQRRQSVRTQIKHQHQKHQLQKRRHKQKMFMNAKRHHNMRAARHRSNHRMAHRMQMRRKMHRNHHR